MIPAPILPQTDPNPHDLAFITVGNSYDPNTITEFSIKFIIILTSSSINIL